MRAKNLKTGLEGRIKDIKAWEDIIKKTADHKNRVYYCNLKQKPCDTPAYHNCMYQDVYELKIDYENETKKYP